MTLTCKLFIAQTKMLVKMSLKYCELMLLVIAYIYIWIIYETKTCMDFSFYCRHIPGLKEEMIFGIDPKLHICIEHLAHELKYCIIIQFEINID